MNLSRLVGNARLKGQLSRPELLPHAAIIGGPQGSGRHTLATLLAQAMLCQHPEQAPCGKCLPCRRVAEGIHPDVIPVSRFQTKEEQTKDLSVGTIRLLRADAYIRPNQAERKVYLIDRADTMNVSAQNALLKVLEDGPEYAVFFLIAENPMSLLQTIRSRCALYELGPVSPEEALPVLRGRFPGRSDSELTQAVQTAHGLIGVVTALLEGNGQQEPPEVAKSLDALCAALSRRSELVLMEWSVQIQNDKWSRDQLVSLYRGIVRRATNTLTGDAEGIDWRKALSPAQLLALTDLAREGERAMELNVYPAHSAGWFAVSAWKLVSTS
ncbi:MAG: DNA polymerase III subunit [Clostridiales bacterium]|nr:DNA polymerase III subunit [Clostridiales bacterium]